MDLSALTGLIGAFREAEAAVLGFAAKVSAVKAPATQAATPTSSAPSSGKKPEAGRGRIASIEGIVRLLSNTGSLASYAPRAVASAASESKSFAEGGKGGNASATLDVLTGGLGSMIGAFAQVTNVATQFVSALNPAIVQNFQRVANDLTATVGVALVPIVNAATTALRSIGETLLPVMRQLQPVIEQITNVALGVLDHQLENLAIVFETVLPIIKDLADVFEALSPLIRAAQVILAGVLSGLGALVEGVWGAVKSFMEGVFGSLGQFTSLKGAMQELAKIVILAAATVAKWVGAMSFITGLQRSLAPKRQTESNAGLAAGTNAQFTGFADFGRAVALQTALAGQGGDSKDSKEGAWRDNVLEELQALQDGQETSLDKLANRLVEAIQAGVSGVIAGVKKKTYEAAAPVAVANPSVVGGLGLLSSVFSSK